jgi:hypothetical protein
MRTEIGFAYLGLSESRADAGVNRPTSASILGDLTAQREERILITSGGAMPIGRGPGSGSQGVDRLLGQC